MSEPFIGEIRMFGGNFAPRGWAFCDGQLVSISSNDALFALLGTIYGGDGRTTFGLPDLRGRIPIHQGQGPGLTNRPIGQKSGVERAGVNVNQLPVHSHPMQASSDPADDVAPGGKVLATSASDIYVEDNPDVAMSAAAVTSVGGSNTHNNVMPFRCIHYIIALTGVFPSRN